MRLGGTAAYAVDVHNSQEVVEAVAWAEVRNLPVIMIGSGSNIVWRDEGFTGLIMVCKIMRYEEQQEDEENWYITAGAGENWDSVVERTVQRGLSGLEALSLIPGTAGATPVQNVGAYGQEITNVLMSVEAYDRQAKQVVILRGDECAFGYRTSRFKAADRGRFFITAVTFHLLHKNPQPPFYPTLQNYFEQHDVHDFTPQAMRDAVIAIRTSKLPDPAKVANNGSFFANPTISEGVFTQIQAEFPGVPHRPAGEGMVKISAAWLMDHIGLKDVHDAATGMATWHLQPLVLVNEHATSTAQLLQFRQKIVDTFKERFEIDLEQEPELLPHQD